MAEIHITEQNEPTTPQGGKTKLYVDEVDSHLKTKDSTGTIVDLTSIGNAPLTTFLVQDAGGLSGTLDSTIEYIIDGVIDMGSQSIEVPAGGLNLKGHNFNVSKQISSSAGYTMFTSPVGGSGDLLGMDYAVEVIGSGSQVYNLVGNTGFESFEFERINYNDCSSLGSVDNYRQSLEGGTGRFGGRPTLTLTGTWLGGYFIDTSIVRSLDSGMTGSLYEAGAGFSMGSRFRSNQNIDLPASASFFDFSSSNFTQPSLIQLSGCILTRDGVVNSADSNLTPNIDASNLMCKWRYNIGISNTFEGGELDITTEVETVINVSGTYEDVLGTYTPAGLQHFDEPANGQLRHLGSDPKEYKVQGQLVIDGGANDVVAVKIVIFRDATTSFEDGKIIIRQIAQLQGGRNVGYFVLYDNITLSQNDYIKLQITNQTDVTNVTAELNSYFTVEAR